MKKGRKTKNNQVLMIIEREKKKFLDYVAKPIIIKNFKTGRIRRVCDSDFIKYLFPKLPYKIRTETMYKFICNYIAPELHGSILDQIRRELIDATTIESDIEKKIELWYTLKNMDKII